MKRWLTALVLCIGTAAQAVSSFTEVRAAHAVSDLTLLDRHGVPLQTLRIDKTVRRLPWVPLDQMSPALLQAVVQSEDRRFWAHSGVDWAASVQRYLMRVRRETGTQADLPIAPARAGVHGLRRR